MENPNNNLGYFSVFPMELIVTVLSLLPTRFAARTSVLSRFFRHCWASSPSLHLSAPNTNIFVAMANRTIFDRDPSLPLLNLHIGMNLYHFHLGSYMPNLLARAASLGLRHLSLGGSLLHAPTLDAIFSITSLESLSMVLVGPFYLGFENHIFPCASKLLSLKKLSLELSLVAPAKVSQLISQLTSLLELDLTIHSMDSLGLSSKTLQTLNLTIGASYALTQEKLHTLNLFLPALTSFNFKTEEDFSSRFHISPNFLICGEVPLLVEASIRLTHINSEDVTAIKGILTFISHVEALHLLVEENTDEEYPFPLLFEPGNHVPVFQNLKSLYIKMCFHMYGLECAIALLRRSPSLQSVRLEHMPCVSLHGLREGDLWRSVLPINDAGNDAYAYFANLHLGENNEAFTRLVGQQWDP